MKSMMNVVGNKTKMNKNIIFYCFTSWTIIWSVFIFELFLSFIFLFIDVTIRWFNPFCSSFVLKSCHQNDFLQNCTFFFNFLLSRIITIEINSYKTLYVLTHRVEANCIYFINFISFYFHFKIFDFFNFLILYFW